MKTFRVILIVLGLVAVVFSALKAKNRIAEAQRNEKAAGLYGGPEGVDAVRRPDRTTVWRLKPSPTTASTPPEPAGTPVVDPAAAPSGGDEAEEGRKSPAGDGAAASSMHPGYVEDGPAVEVPPALAAELSTALASSDSYLWDSAKGCKPKWGLGLAFFKGAHRVDVLLCYECKLIATFLDGKRIALEDFDPIEPLLVSIAKKLFPADAEIQSLDAG